jgi:RNA polymerase-binding transcription factor DksA
MNKEELISKKKELEDRLEKIRQDLGRGLDADFAEQAVQLENHDVLLEIARVSEEELLKINKQLSSAD